MVMHWLFLLAATAFWLAAAVGATPLRARGRLPVAVAHRGASGDAPENTMAAFRLAVDLGSAGFETDLHMTADGVVVLLHDSDIRRTTCGWPDDLPSYNIANLEWSFVSTLDAGSWFGPEFEGERVPLLQEGLDPAAFPLMVYDNGKEHGTLPSFAAAPHERPCETAALLPGQTRQRCREGK